MSKAEDIADAKVPTERQMREAEVPDITSLESLATYIRALVHRQHDYGTCVYAMSMSAVAAFNYAAHVLGVTGFQASCADLDIIRRTRSMDGPFILLKAEDLLYPQYDLRAKLDKFIEEQRDWLRDEAKKKLADKQSKHAAQSVRKHWQKLAE